MNHYFTPTDIITVWTHKTTTYIEHKNKQPLSGSHINKGFSLINRCTQPLYKTLNPNEKPTNICIICETELLRKTKEQFRVFFLHTNVRFRTPAKLSFFVHHCANLHSSKSFSHTSRQCANSQNTCKGCAIFAIRHQNSHEKSKCKVNKS